MIIVIKIGGDLLVNGFPENLAAEIKILKNEHLIVLVHGGGDIVTDISTKLGHPPKFVLSPRGFRSRYTDKETAEIYTMVMAGKINKEIVSTLQRTGVQAIGLSGLDGALIKAKRKEQLVIINERGKKMLIDGGYTGQVTEVNGSLLQLLLENGFLPVISSIAISEQADPLNVDGDRIAANVASAIKASLLVLLTDVEGVFLDDKPVRELPLAKAKDALKNIGAGMITKVHAAIEAVNGGVEEVIIASGVKDGSISAAINHGNGTVIRS
jgi:acetylglutamate/LysW-gamma-L-alpha-aminoadipate kinase